MYRFKLMTFSELIQHINSDKRKIDYGLFF